MTRELSEVNNFWLKSLTNDIKEISEVERLIEEYGKKKVHNLYKSIMDIIVRANREKFQEVKKMCEALEELMEEEFEAVRTKAKIEGRAEGRAEGREMNLLNQICKKLRKGKEPIVISEELEEEYEVIKNICRIAEEFAPDYNCDLLFQKLHM